MGFISGSMDFVQSASNLRVLSPGREQSVGFPRDHTGCCELSAGDGAREAALAHVLNVCT